MGRLGAIPLSIHWLSYIVTSCIFHSMVNNYALTDHDITRTCSAETSKSWAAGRRSKENVFRIWDFAEIPQQRNKWLFSQSVHVAIGWNGKFCSTKLGDETAKGCSLKERKQWRQPRGLLNGTWYLIMTFVYLCMCSVTFVFPFLLQRGEPCRCTPVNCMFLHVHGLDLRVFTALKQLIKLACY